MRKPMKMQDWIKKLDDFLNLSDFEILQHQGKISHQQALKKVNEEYDKYKAVLIEQKSRVQEDFEKAIKAIEAKHE